MKSHIEIVAKELNISLKQVTNTAELLSQKATIPFISRYRKEATGSLDEVQIANIKDRLDKLAAVALRRQSVIESIGEQGKLTDELRAKLENAYTLNEIEDLYLPYKQKRKTRAYMAREKGLEPLAQLVYEQTDAEIEKVAQNYLNEKVATVDDALQGARDIIAEWINENVQIRNSIRNLFDKQSVIKTTVVKNKEQEGEKYADYFAFSEKLSNCASHRLLAMYRGANEGFLSLSITPPEEEAIQYMEKTAIRFDSKRRNYCSNEASQHVRKAISDSYKRLMHPSIETEFYNIAKEKADEEAIKVFTTNLRQLLLSAPLGQKRVLALDPGYRTGCKVVCLNEQGDPLHHTTIYPHPPQNQKIEAADMLHELVSSFALDSIAIGNGTASRETEQFVKQIPFKTKVKVFVVSENGASIYSASQVAREELPNYDVTIRGAVSIGRRLIDPLAELVKIDPKSIGVGQYQHDVDQNRLQASLDRVVESCVNLVGVNVNTASKHLLTYISGLGPALAQNIVEYRQKNGSFKSRKELKKVARLGEKAYEQCAGFLRIPNGDTPLDNSAVHPESYPVVEKMARDLGCTINDLITRDDLRKSVDINHYISKETGLPTLIDIMNELAKPGRDPRSKIEEFAFSEAVQTIDDLNEGMVLSGIVTNITNFGAFVDIGIKENGLVHVSQICEKFITNPAEMLSLHQKVFVKVIAIDKPRKRIQLSMKEINQ